MILAFSTSSKVASVALLSGEGEVIWAGSEEAHHGASGACLALVEQCRNETGLRPLESDLFAADLGPGSFTGVRVGIVLAKTFAFLGGRPCIGADAFDLIDPAGVVALPSKKGEYFVRIPGEAPVRQTELPSEPFLGFGPDVPVQTFPEAARFGRLIGSLEPVAAELFVPKYLIDPSISIPKKPFAGAGS